MKHKFEMKIGGTTSGLPVCNGDVDSIGTFARYDTITGLAILYPDISVNANEVALYVADQLNNKLKVLDLSTLASTTVSTNVDSTGFFQLAGLTIYQFNLYVGVPGAILKFSINPSTYELTNKLVFSGIVGTLGYTDGSYFTTSYGFINYLTHDGAGNLYIGDHTSAPSGNNIDSIRRLSAQNGNVTTMAGKTGRNFLIVFDSLIMFARVCY